MQVAILVFDGVSAAEALGPFEIFRRVPRVDTRFVARREGPHTVHGNPGVLVADRSLTDLPAPDVVFVPGGFGARRLIVDREILAWLQHGAASAECVAGVSTGSLLLAAAGVLDGVEATSHWLVVDELATLGAVPRTEPIGERDRVITAGGGASALEVTYRILGRVFGTEVAYNLRQQLADESQNDVGAPPSPRRRRLVAPAAASAEGALSPYVLD